MFSPIRFHSLSFALLALTAATTGWANSADRITARVSLDGIDLTVPSHQRDIDQRLTTAARRACMVRDGGAPRITDGTRACMAEMIADGRAQVRTLAARAAGTRAVAVR